MQYGTFSGGGLGFGVAFTLADHFSSVADKIQGKMDQMENSTNEMADRINQSLGKIQAGAIMVATGLGLLAPLGHGYQLAAEYEQLNIAFETMLGSGEAAKKMLNDIDSFAVKTPFNLRQVEDGTKKLLAYGIAQDDVMADMKALGDISAAFGDKQKFDSFINAYGQVRAAGKLLGGEMRQFRNAGLNMVELLRNIGVEVDTASNIADQNISFEKVQAAMRAATDEGGRYANMMDKLSQTAGGKWSNIEDLIDRMFRTIGMLEVPIMHVFFDLMIPALEWITDFVQSDIGKWVVGIMSVILVIAALSIVLIGLKMIVIALGSAITTVLVPMLPMIAGIVLMIAQIAILYKLLNSTNDILVLVGITMAIAMGPIGMIAGGVFLLIRAWRSFTDVMENGAEPAGGILGILQKIGGIMQAVVAIFSSANSEGFSMSEEMYKSLQNLGIAELVVSIGTYIVRIKHFLRGVKEGFMEAFGQMKMWVLDLMAPFEQLVTKGQGWSDWLGRNTSDMNKWKDAGLLVGKVLLAVFAGLIVALGIIAITSLIAFLPQILIIGAIVAAVYLLIKYWDVAKYVVAGLGVAMLIAFAPMVAVIGAVLLGMWALYEAAVALGAMDKIDFIEDSKDKIKGLFAGGMETEIEKAKEDNKVTGGGIASEIEVPELPKFDMGNIGIDSLPDLDLEKMQGSLSDVKIEPTKSGLSEKQLGEITKDVSFEDEEGSIEKPEIEGRAFNFTQMAQTDARNKAQSTTPTQSEPKIIDKSTETVKTIEVKVMIDSDEVADKVIEKQELTEARK